MLAVFEPRVTMLERFWSFISQDPKKWTESLMIGPPIEAPACQRV
jgi:hypothetical protein